MAGPELLVPPGLARTEFEAMGTTVSVLAPSGAGDAVSEVRSLFSTWEGRLSRFLPDSELSAVNRSAGSDMIVSPLFAEVAREALRAAAATEGLFDPTVHDRLADLGYEQSFAELPADLPARPLRPRTAGAWRRIRLDGPGRRIYLPRGVGLDFGGIAKGMAVDAAISLLAAHGARPAAVDAGGDLAVVGVPPGASEWVIAVALPAGTENVSLTSGALATSSVGVRRWRSGGHWRHHIVDPRTGQPADAGLWSVTAAAATCREAEVAAKVALILGPEAGAHFLKTLGIDALLVFLDGRTRRVEAAARPAQAYMAPAQTPGEAAR